MKKLLSATRKKILVYWYNYHYKDNLWPSFQNAADDLNLSKFTIHYHVKILISEDWMTKDGNRTALTKYGEGKIFEASLIASGEKKKEITKSDMLINKIKKR